MPALLRQRRRRRVTAPNPMAMNHSETIKVFAARSGSERFIRRDA
jgi:hypothetical protein